MALETEAGYLHYKFRIGRGVANIKGAMPINDNNWHKVELERLSSYFNSIHSFTIGCLVQYSFFRIGNFGKMTVQSTNTGGGVLSSNSYITNTTSGATSSKEMRMFLPNSVSTKFVVGGMPSFVVSFRNNFSKCYLLILLILFIMHSLLGHCSTDKTSLAKSHACCLLDPNKSNLWFPYHWYYSPKAQLFHVKNCWFCLHIWILHFWIWLIQVIRKSECQPAQIPTHKKSRDF